MNIKSLIFVVATLMMTVECKKKKKNTKNQAAVASITSDLSEDVSAPTGTPEITDASSDNDNTSNGSAQEDKQLAEIFKKMKTASGGMAMDLDSTFGGNRCNCVCKDL